MYWSVMITMFALGLTVAQKVGTVQSEIHPKLQWTRCAADEGCAKIDGELVMDANWRWIHKVDDIESCYWGNRWDERVCSSVEDCTNTCALEGAQYERAQGVTTANGSVTQKFRTNHDFSYNIGSRLFLLESKDRYQMFTLLNHELAFEVDLSTVECGIKSALYFVPMDPDGGQAQYPTNQAGAEYGTGYCDANCPRNLRYVGGETNSESWFPSETDEFSGTGRFGACCPQFSVWNSNAHSFSMSSHVCPDDASTICDHFQGTCDHYTQYPDDRKKCDLWGCSYNPYRMGNTDFYGKGKKVDTARKFTVVTQWNGTRVTQFFVQDGRKIEMPAPVWDGLPKEAGLSADMCQKQRLAFDERDHFTENGGWKAHQRQLLTQPMVMVLSINSDHFTWNLWLDSDFPPEIPDGAPGKKRGDCRFEDNDPIVVNNRYPKAEVVWSNIRFGPIGTTINV